MLSAASLLKRIVRAMLGFLLLDLGVRHSSRSGFTFSVDRGILLCRGLVGCCR